MKRIVCFLGVVAVFALACGRAEIKGTYDVELQILGVAQPFSGTLILSSQPLDIPSLSETNESIDSNWFGGDALSANSCFILAPRVSPSGASDDYDDRGAEPRLVRVFEARIEPTQVRVPLEILHASDLQIEITKLQFFANALGGELDIHTADGVRPGRIHGTRIDSAKPQRCIESLSAFREYLRQLPAQADSN